MRPSDHVDWASLESNCQRPEIQEAIGVAIRAGTIRVVPAPNGRIRIIPLEGAMLPACDVAGPPPTQRRETLADPPRLIRTTRPSIRRLPGTALSGPSN